MAASKEIRAAYDRERYSERRVQYAQAVERLREVLALPESDVVRDSTIQRFEFTYELAWKTLQSYLQGEAIDARSPRQALQEAFQQGLVSDADGWGDVIEWRNLTSHTYDMKRAEGAYLFVRQKGFSLFEQLLKKLPE